MAKPSKKVQTYYLKRMNIDWLNKKAFHESTPDSRVTDDSILDGLLDRARESENSPAKPKSKKTPEQLVAA